MKITIHRGINQIGGCITEVQSSSGTKILIDLGHNLPDEDGQAKDEYDVPENLDCLLDGVSAVFYTHYHGDHIAFEAAVNEKGVDQYLGQLAKKVKEIFYDHMSKGPNREKYEAALNAVRKFKTYRADETVTINDINITPYYVSHSAADAYMFVLECDGKKILHTGDFRDHGYLRNSPYGVLKKYVVNEKTDVLITEGTMLSRADERMMSERELQQRAFELMKVYRYVFVLCSSTDLDRLASFYQATDRCKDRPFLADGYQCMLLKAFTNAFGHKIPEYNFSAAIRFNSAMPQKMTGSGFTMLVRASSVFMKWMKALVPMLPKEETVIIYSQYRGYIEPGNRAFNATTCNFIKAFEWNFEYLHTSGHASREALAKVCNIVNPSSAIIPIHKDNGSDFRSLDITRALIDRIVESDTIVDDIEIQAQ